MPLSLPGLIQGQQRQPAETAPLTRRLSEAP